MWFKKAATSITTGQAVKIVDGAECLSIYFILSEYMTEPPFFLSLSLSLSAVHHISYLIGT